MTLNKTPQNKKDKHDNYRTINFYWEQFMLYGSKERDFSICVRGINQARYGTFIMQGDSFFTENAVMVPNICSIAYGEDDTMPSNPSELHLPALKKSPRMESFGKYTESQGKKINDNTQTIVSKKTK